MAWYDDSGDFWNLLGDPAGYVSGTNTEGIGGVKKMLFGDPESVKKAYDDAIAMAGGSSANTQALLQKQKQDSLKYYAPLQHMFESSYGTEGLRPQQDTGPLTKMYGSR